MRHPDTHQLPCGFTEERLIASALGEVSPAESREVGAHVAHCPACQGLRERYRDLSSHLDAVSAGAGDDAGLALARRRLDARLVEHPRPRLQLEVWHSPVGDLRIGRTDKGVALVEFIRPGGRAPRGPIRADLVGDVVERACKRAGLSRVGPHRLRHALAGELLAHGAGLVAISQVLRHQDLATTALYAKVDLDTLRHVAQPWPGTGR